MQSLILVVRDRLVRVHVLELTLIGADLLVRYRVHNLSRQLDLSSEFTFQFSLF